MADALSALSSGMVTWGGTFITQFLPILGIVAGIGLAMWVLTFARDFFRGE